MISDGGGLPFAPGALAGAPAPLDPLDPAVAALAAHLAARPKAKPSRLPWRRTVTAPATIPGLEGWRLLARTDDEALFGRGLPPALMTVAVSKDARRGSWAYAAHSAGRPLRATRDGIRASSWRLDPTREPEPGETQLRVLVTEQTFAGGQRATGRVLAPDVYADEHELVLTMFVTPRPGYQPGSRNPETPVRVALAEPLGNRRVIDGALMRFAAPVASTPATANDAKPGAQGAGVPDGTPPAR